VRSARQWKKIPGAVFRDGGAVPGRGCCAEVSHLPNAVIAALGGQRKKVFQAAAARRQASRQEPGAQQAVTPPAGICAGVRRS